MAGIGLNRSRQAPAEDTPSFGAIAERFRRAGDLDRAIALCHEGLKKFPNQLSARVTLGWAFLDKGEYDHARQELERVIRRAPDNLAAIRGLAELHDRAEHAVSGVGPDGMWVPAEDLSEVHEAPVVVDAAAPDEPEPYEPAMPAAPPPLPIPTITSANDDVNPLSLIETPAQAAVAHSGHADEAEPVVSVFEHVIEQAADAVVPASAEPVVQNAADWSELDVTPAGSPLAALQEVEDVWEPAMPVTASEPASDAVLLAENAEVELARVASEFGGAESDPVAADVVIDLPEADDVLAGEFIQFEAAPPVEITAAFEEATLDPVLPPAGIAAAEELEVLDSVFSAAANEPEPDLVLQLEEEDPLDPQADPVLTVETEPEGAIAAALTIEQAPHEAQEIVVDPTTALVAVEDAATAEAVADEPASDESEFGETVAEAAAEPEAVREVVPQAEAAPALEAAPPVEVAPEPEVVPEPEVAPEPEQVLAPEPAAAAAVVDAISETELEQHRVVDSGLELAEPVDLRAEPVAEPVAEPMEVAGASDAAEIEDEVGDDPIEWNTPDVAWMPPAGDTAGVPAMASAAHMTEEEMHTLFPPPAPAPTRAPAPIARLEAFLQKVTSRRLHLNPDSVA